MYKPPVRTITLGLEQAHPLPSTTIAQVAHILGRARQSLQDAGYEVQTVRISTRPIFDDLASWSSRSIVDYVQELQSALDESELSYCSLGPAQAARPEFSLARIDLIPDLLASAKSISLSVQLANRYHGMREKAAGPIARAIKRLANETTEGLGNFNFAMLACVGSATPFFPAAYHSGPPSLSLGLQGAGIIHNVA